MNSQLFKFHSSLSDVDLTSKCHSPEEWKSFHRTENNKGLGHFNNGGTKEKLSRSHTKTL